MAADADEWPEASVVRTTGSTRSSLKQALTVLREGSAG
jgi:hypothetical protein